MKYLLSALGLAITFQHASAVNCAAIDNPLPVGYATGDSNGCTDGQVLAAGDDCTVKMDTGYASSGSGTLTYSCDSGASAGDAANGPTMTAAGCVADYYEQVANECHPCGANLYTPANNFAGSAISPSPCKARCAALPNPLPAGYTTIGVTGATCIAGMVQTAGSVACNVRIADGYTSSGSGTLTYLCDSGASSGDASTAPTQTVTGCAADYYEQVANECHPCGANLYTPANNFAGSAISPSPCKARCAALPNPLPAGYTTIGVTGATCIAGMVQTAGSVACNVRIADGYTSSGSGTLTYLCDSGASSGDASTAPTQTVTGCAANFYEQVANECTACATNTTTDAAAFTGSAISTSPCEAATTTAATTTAAPTTAATTTAAPDSPDSGSQSQTVVSAFVLTIACIAGFRLM